MQFSESKIEYLYAFCDQMENISSKLINFGKFFYLSYIQSNDRNFLDYNSRAVNSFILFSS